MLAILAFLRTSRIAHMALVVLIACAVMWAIVELLRGQGAAEERERQAAETARASAEQRAAERTAEEQRRQAEAQARNAAAARRQEIEDATRNIPDQVPSARQRSRACIQLWRERPTDSATLSACGPAPAPRSAANPG